jgi:EAL domain-containing protein (putative c-di-GMP-specific phosphodiesterase class I)
LIPLAWLRLEAGDAAEAEQLCRIALDAGEPIAMGALAETWEKTGRREEADRLREHGLDADGVIAESWFPA